MPRKNRLDGSRGVFAESHGEDSIRTLTTLAGAFLVLLGGYLPWLRYNPDYEGAGLVLSPQTQPGFEGFDLLLLAPVGLVVAFFAVSGATKWWARATAVVGVVAVLLPAVAAVGTYTDPNPYYVPDLGLAVTALGGFLLLAVSGYDRDERG